MPRKPKFTAADRIVSSLHEMTRQGREVTEAVQYLALEIRRQRLEAAALRRVIETATGYEHPAHARLRGLGDPEVEG